MNARALRYKQLAFKSTDAKTAQLLRMLADEAISLAENELEAIPTRLAFPGARAIMKFLSEWFDRVDRNIIPVSVDAGLAVLTSLLIVSLLQVTVAMV